MNTNCITEVKKYLNLRTGKVTNEALVNGHINPILYILYSDIKRLSDNIVMAVIDNETKIIFENTGNYVSMPVTTYNVYVHKTEINMDKNKKNRLIIRTVLMAYEIAEIEIDEDCNIQFKKSKSKNTFNPLKIFQASLVVMCITLLITKIIQSIMNYTG